MKVKTKKHIDLLDGESYQIRKIKDNRPYAEIMDEGIRKQNEEFKNALKRAGWTNVEDINWNYDSPEWNKKEKK